VRFLGFFGYFFSFFMMVLLIIFVIVMTVTLKKNCNRHTYYSVLCTGTHRISHCSNMHSSLC
jgi:uncharacterized membrane protein YoaK (UPF0700 family)